MLLITALLGTSVSPSLGKPVPNFLFSSTSLLQQGKAYYEAGRFAQAAQVLQQAVQEYQKQKDAKKLVIALSNLSLTYQQLGAWERAKQTMAESLNILGYQLQETEGQTSPFSHAKLKIHDLPLLARSLDILGRLQLATGQAEKAWKTWNNSAVIYKKLGDRNGVAQSQLNQAQALIESGFFRRAEATLLQVQQTLSSQPDSVEKAVTLRSLGDVFQLLGDLEQSRTFLLQSWEVAKRLQSSQQIAASLFSLGNNARKQQQIPQALEFYQQAIKQTSSPLLQLQAQLNCLSLLVEQGKSSQAETLLPQIQSLLEHLPPSRASIYARINFAQTLGRMNPTFSKASAQLLTIAFQQARDIDDKHSQAYALGSLGSLYEQTGQLAEAQNLTQQALILAQAHNALDIAYRWQWQLGRILNLLLQKLQQYQPRAIGLDIYRDFPAESPDLINRLRQTPNLVGICKGSDASINTNGIEPPPEIPQANLGFSDFIHDPDGVVRRHLLFMNQETASPCPANYAFSLQLAARYLEALGMKAKFTPQGDLQLQQVILQRLRSRTGPYQGIDANGGQILLNYRSSKQVAEQVTLTQFLSASINPNAIKNRIVLIGVVAKGDFPDYWATPYGTELDKQIPGVLVQAHALSQILSAVLDKRPLLVTWYPWVETGWICIWSLTGGAAVATLLVWQKTRHSLLGLAVIVTASLAILYIFCLVFFLQGYWVPLVPPVLTLTGSIGITAILNSKFLGKNSSRANNSTTAGITYF